MKDSQVASGICAAAVKNLPALLLKSKDKIIQSLFNSNNNNHNIQCIFEVFMVLNSPFNWQVWLIYRLNKYLNK